MVFDLENLHAQLLDECLVDVLPALGQLFHLVDLAEVGPFDVLDRLTSKHEEVAFASGDRRAVPREESVLAEYVHVTKMAALDIGNECDVLWSVELFI